MSILDPDAVGPATWAVRGGQHRSAEQEHCEPIFTTSSFVFSSAAEAAARFSGESPGNLYSRFTNPTVRAFEERLAGMEGGSRGVATASGMAAILSLCMGVLSAGDRVVVSRSVFGSTVLLFTKILARFGVHSEFVDLTDLPAWEAAAARGARLLFLETPANPLTQVADIPALAEIAQRHGALLAVDNCFCTPVLQRPLDLGADVVVHSATKYLDGQGRGVGGAVVAADPAVADAVHGFLRTAGPSMSPFNAWLFLKGLETLPVRMRAHCEHAQAVAEWLAAHPAVARVHYPGLAGHPQHGLAARQQSGAGGLVAFEARGGREAAWAVVDATRVMSITANLGDTRSTITHPATTTHGRLSPQELEAAGIGQGLLRVAVGLEDPSDLITDLARGLDALR